MKDAKPLVESQKTLRNGTAHSIIVGKGPGGKWIKWGPNSTMTFPVSKADAFLPYAGITDVDQESQAAAANVETITALKVQLLEAQAENAKLKSAAEESSSESKGSKGRR
jgi:hypothetical protein